MITPAPPTGCTWARTYRVTWREDDGARRTITGVDELTARRSARKLRARSIDVAIDVTVIAVPHADAG